MSSFHRSLVPGRPRRLVLSLCLVAVSAWPLWPARAASYPLPAPGNDLVGRVKVIKARHKDTLSDLARRYGLGYDEIRRANPDVDPWLPGAGTRVVIPTRFILPHPWKGIVLNVAEMRLFYYPKVKPGESGRVITFPVSIGRGNWETPLVTTRVTAKITDPSWHPPKSIRAEHAREGDPLPAVVPAGPDNPLGQFALRLGLPAYLIHGTNKPYGIGMRVTHGCIRLYPEDIRALFKEVPVNTPVRIINRPVEVGWEGASIYLEAYPGLGPALKPGQAMARVRRRLAARAARVPGRSAAEVDWKRVREALRRPRGLPVKVSADGIVDPAPPEGESAEK